LIQRSCVVFGNLVEQILQPACRVTDFFFEMLVFVEGGGELLAQLVIVGAQTLTQLDELIYLLFERFEFRFHSHTIGLKILLSQLLTIIFEGDLAPVSPYPNGISGGG
jgi:hypothetical protein